MALPVEARRWSAAWARSVAWVRLGALAAFAVALGACTSCGGPLVASDGSESGAANADGGPPGPPTLKLATLTDGPWVDRNVRLSWDEAWVAFERHTYKDVARTDPQRPADRVVIMVAPVPGEDGTVVGSEAEWPDSANGRDPSFTRDGRLLFQRGGELILGGREGGAPLRISTGALATSVSKPRVSPSGERIAFLGPAAVASGMPSPGVVAHVYDIASKMVRRVGASSPPCLPSPTGQRRTCWSKTEYALQWVDDEMLLVYRHEMAGGARMHRATLLRVPTDPGQPVRETLGWFGDLGDTTRAVWTSRRVVTSAFRGLDYLSVLSYDETEGAMVKAPGRVLDIDVHPAGRLFVASVVPDAGDEGTVKSPHPGKPARIMWSRAPARLPPVADALAAMGIGNGL